MKMVENGREGTVWKHQWSCAHHLVLGEDYDPRQEMLISLTQLLVKYPAHGLIIGGDFNGIDEGDPSDDGSILCYKAKCGVIEIHTDFLAGPFPSTHDRGTHRIDQVYTYDRLSTENLVHALTIGGYDSIFPSDHRPLFLDFGALSFFDVNYFTSQP